MNIPIKYTVAIPLLYLFCMFGWFVLFAVLKVNCVFNFNYVVEGLFTRQVHEDFVKGLSGALAYHADVGKCSSEYLYHVRLYPDPDDHETYEIKSLSAFVDLDSWYFEAQESVNTYFTDKSYRYTLVHMSDEVFMKVTKK